MAPEDVKAWRKAERERLIAAREQLDASMLGSLRHRIDAHLDDRQKQRSHGEGPHPARRRESVNF